MHVLTHIERRALQTLGSLSNNFTVNRAHILERKAAAAKTRRHATQNRKAERSRSSSAFALHCSPSTAWSAASAACAASVPACKSKREESSGRAKACKTAALQASVSQILQPGAAQRIIPGAAYQVVVIFVVMV